MKIFKDKKIILGFFVVFLTVFIFYGDFLKLYFSQDDFFLLRVTLTDGSLNSFLKLFTFRPFEESGIYFFRPLFRELIFNQYYQLFGANPLPFRVTHFLIHFINTVLVYFVLLKILKEKNLAMISSFLFAILAPNVGILSYLAGGITVSGMLMLALISMLFQYRYIESNQFKYNFFSFIFFLLALSSHETASVLPIILLATRLRIEGFSFKSIINSIKNLWFYVLPVIVLFFVEVNVIGLPVNESGYGLNFSITRLLNSYFWYSLWSIGIPEMLVDFVGPGLNINPNLMKYWGNYFSVIFALFLIFFLISLRTVKKIMKDRSFFLFLFWFFIGITPVVFLPFHRQSHYLQIVLPAIVGLLALIYKKLLENSKVLANIFLLSVISLSYTTNLLTRTTHWSIQRSIQAEILLSQFSQKYEKLPLGAKVYFTNNTTDPYFNEDWGRSSKQASIILSGNDALQIIYKDPTIKVFYEDLNKPTVGDEVYPFEVRIK